MGYKKSTLYIDEDLIKEARKIAIDKNTSLSKIVNDLLMVFIGQHHSDKKKE